MTGTIKTRIATDEYRKGWDAIDWHDDERPECCDGCPSWPVGAECPECTRGDAEDERDDR